MLKVDWYLEIPHDFEYKNYILLDYLQSVDKSFQIHKLSPYLLWTEKLVDELQKFQSLKLEFSNSLKKEKLIFTNNQIQFIKSGVEDTENIKSIFEIVDYSKPILLSKIKLGYKLLEKYPQLLF
jgi:hypothetical protein